MEAFHLMVVTSKLTHSSFCDTVIPSAVLIAPSAFCPLGTIKTALGVTISQTLLCVYIYEKSTIQHASVGLAQAHPNNCG